MAHPYQERAELARVSRRQPRTAELVPAKSREGNFGLSQEFWARFHQRYWGKRGVVLRQALSRSLVTPEEAFRGLVSAGERYRAGQHESPISFCIEHAIVQADVGRYLPAPTDNSPAAYATRVTRQIRGKRFGLVAQDVQGDDARLWFRLREFVKSLYTVTGWPGEKAKASVFFGNYANTPFGVHRDGFGVFNFVLYGRKRILAWAPAFFEGKEDPSNRLDYKRYANEAIVFEGEPGDIIYLPPGYWHIGEGVSGLSMTVNLALFMAPHVMPSLLNIAERMLQDHVGAVQEAVADALRPRLRRPSRAAIARTAKRTAQALRSASSGPELDRSFVAYWLNHITGSGFIVVPDPLPEPRSVPDEAVLHGHRENPVLWLTAERDELICSANGHAFVLARGSGLVPILRRINSGAPCRLGDLIDQHERTTGSGADRSAGLARTLIKKLWSLRAIVVET
jgi:ribosomal protein L16 Arg81 hydroxylase